MSVITVRSGLGQFTSASLDVSRVAPSTLTALRQQARSPLASALQARNVVTAYRSPVVEQTFRQAAEQAAAARAADAGTGEEAQACECYVAQLAEYANSSGMVFDAAAATEQMSACVADPQAYKDFLTAQLQVNVEACKPWYMRKRTWLIAGGLGLGVVALYALL